MRLRTLRRTIQSTYICTPVQLHTARSLYRKIQVSMYMNLNSLYSFIHSGHFDSASSSPLLLRSAPDTARILCRSFTSKRSRNRELWSLAQGIRGGQSGIRTHEPPVERLRLYQCATTSHTIYIYIGLYILVLKYTFINLFACAILMIPLSKRVPSHGSIQVNA